MSRIPKTSRKLSFALAVVAFVVCCYTASGSFAGDTVFKYDVHGRVIEAFYPDSTRITYAYDQAGNRTQAIAALSVASSSSSGGTNVPPVCSPQSNTISGVPSNITVNVTILADQFTNLCTDANGDTLSVTTPATLPHTFTLNPASSVSTSYTVSDGRSPALTDSDVITYTRQ